MTEVAFQRCHVHFLRNALDHLPRKADDECLQELRWLGACPWAGRRPDPRDRRSIEEARQDLAAWIAKWGARYPKLVGWGEETIGQGADLLETRGWDDLASGVIEASYS